MCTHGQPWTDKHDGRTGGHINTERTNNSQTAFLGIIAQGKPYVRDLSGTWLPNLGYFKYQVPRPSLTSLQPLSLSGSWSQALGLSSVEDSVHLSDQLAWLELCWWVMHACCQNREHTHTENSYKEGLGRTHLHLEMIWCSLAKQACWPASCLHMTGLTYSPLDPLSVFLRLFSAIHLGPSFPLSGSFP